VGTGAGGGARGAAMRRAAPAGRATTPATAPAGHDIARLLADLERSIAAGGRAVVAFSGGVDSSLVAAVAARALGPDALAVTAVSPAVAAGELDGARGVAAAIGIAHETIATDELAREGYRRNGPDRCYFCKNELFTRISQDVVAAHGLTAVAYGENADDARRPDRPGARAAHEHGVLTPLADAGLDKTAVRRVARALGLPSADKPAAPCLASRIPHFDEVTPHKLAQVDAAEAALRRVGLADLRVRHHGEVARVEVPVEDVAAVAADPLRQAVVDAVRGAGFRYVALDLAGIQSGSFTLTQLQLRA
jgi:uncharacterized protein